MRRLKHAGLTLVEVIVALAVLAILTMASAPYVGDYVANSRLREGAFALQSQAMLAQNEAVKRNALVEFSAAGGVVRVTDVSMPDPDPMRQQALPAGVTVAAPVSIRFGGSGRPVPFGAEYRVPLRLADRACGQPYRCPALQVDAGGGVRLCKDAASCR